MVLIVRPFCDGARPCKAMPGPSPQPASTLRKMKASHFRQLHAAPYGVSKTPESGCRWTKNPSGQRHEDQAGTSHQRYCATAREASRMAEDYCGQLLEYDGLRSGTNPG